MATDPNWGEWRRSELLTFTDEIFSRGFSTEIHMKMQNCKWDFFPLSIWSVGKRGMALRGVPSPPCSDLSKVAVERLYISFELTGIWNVIDRFPELNHYLVFDCNVSFFLLLQYCLHFTFVKRALIELCKGRYFYLSARSMKMCLQVPSTVYTPQ